MAYAPINPVAGGGPVADLWTPDTTQRFPLGMTIDAVDPEFWGAGKFRYLKTAGAHDPGAVVMVTDESFAVEVVPDTANTAFPFYVARQVFSATGQYGWFQMSGLAPVQVGASVAAGVAIGLSAGTAGKLGTLATGKQVWGIRVLQASTYAPTKTGRVSLANKKVIQLPNVAGLFKGLVCSGTGVGSGAKIVSVNPSQREVVVDVDSTATGNPTVTFTWTGFVLVDMNCPCVAGALA